MRVDDLIVLGRTAPEDSKTYGESVCMAGYSPEFRQFMRVYPLNTRSNIKARDVISAELERNNKDHRIESWAIKGRDESKSIRIIGDLIEKEDIRLYFDKNTSESITELNKKRLSLGVIKPDIFEVVLKTREAIKDPNQLYLFDDCEKQYKLKTAGDYFIAPYIRITCGSFTQCIQIREWGVYELMRKRELEGERITPDYLQKALRITPDRIVYFVVGNMNQFRNNWLIIKSFSYKKNHQQKSLFN